MLHALLVQGMRTACVKPFCNACRACHGTNEGRCLWELQQEQQPSRNACMRAQVNEELMARAKPDALFLHCLPAERGIETTDAVVEGPQSVVFQEAENRMHAQNGILMHCLGLA